MAIVYKIASADDALLDAYEGQSLMDPGVYLPSGDTMETATANIAGGNVLTPMMNNILALIAGRNANADYGQTFDCDVSRAVNDPVYLSASSTVTLSLATSFAAAKIIGFIRSKPTTITCKLAAYAYSESVGTGVVGNTVYLQDDGTLGPSVGTVTKPCGVYITTTTALLWASPESALIGGALTGDVSGVLPSITVPGMTRQLFNHFADVGNVGAGVDDLYSDTIAAGRLATNGDKLHAVYAGIWGGTVTGILHIYGIFGSTGGPTQFFDTGAITVGATPFAWSLDVEIIRVSSSVVRVAATFTSASPLLQVTTQYFEITGLTLSNTQVQKLACQAATDTTDNQIVAKSGYIEFKPAA